MHDQMVTAVGIMTWIGMMEARMRREIQIRAASVGGRGGQKGGQREGEEVTTRLVQKPERRRSRLLIYTLQVQYVCEVVIQRGGSDTRLVNPHSQYSEMECRELFRDLLPSPLVR